MRNRTVARRAITAIKAGVNFLFRADFCVDEAAPMSNPYTPLIGSDLTLVQNDGSLGISGGKLEITGQTTPTQTDLGAFASVGIAKQDGLTLFVNVRRSALDSEFMPHFGFHSAAALPAVFGAEDAGIAFRDGNNIVTAGNFPIIRTFTDATDYDFVVAVRDASYLLYLRESLGDWEFLWSQANTISATLYPFIRAFDADATVDTMRVRQLAASLYAPSVSIADPSVAPTGNAPNKDFFKESTITSEPSAGNMDFNFRIQDATNFWQRRIKTSGDLELNEIVAGIPALRGSSAAAFAAGETERLITDDETITSFANQITKVSYSSAANFKTELAYDFSDFGTAGDEDNVSMWEQKASGALLNNFNNSLLGDCVGNGFSSGFSDGFS